MFEPGANTTARRSRQRAQGNSVGSARPSPLCDQMLAIGKCLTPACHTLQSVAMAEERQSGLRPSVWRTCRVLASPVRLRVLRQVAAEPDQTVSAVAGSLGLGLPVASQSLRALNARGLLGVRRQGRWVYYRPAGDPTVPGSTLLLRSLMAALEEGPDAMSAVCRLATGLTHPRRVDIVRALAPQPLTRPALGRSTGISPSALGRHLRKLMSRGYVAEANGLLTLARPRAPVAAALLALATRA